MSPRSLFLTFGPVQEYLSQARRTRDLWAGSYLLSFLAAHALHAAREAGGQVRTPSLIGNALFEAVASGGQPQSPGNRVGSIPHVAEIEVPDGKQPKEVADAAIKGWRDAWSRVADAVRVHAQRSFPGWTPTTSTLWDQQVNPAEIWTATWVTTPQDMRRRKTLRNFTLSDVQGEKCTVCGTRQALHGGDDSRQGVRAFWKAVADRLGEMEVRSARGERLCALCAVKRFYPLVAQEALGWPVQSGYPSTATMTTILWRKRLLEKGLEQGEKAERLRRAVAEYVQTLRAEGVSKPLERDRFPALHAAAQQWGAQREAALKFLCYDGDWLDEDSIRAETGNTERAQRLLAAFSKLAHTAAEAGVSPSGTSYALLAMDGDNMGKLLRAAGAMDGGKERVSLALASFSQQVRTLVEGSAANGVLIYAGGDDVLALLPSATALDTAQAIRQAYQSAFQGPFPSGTPAGAPQPTISAGLVFAHAQTPLQQVVKAAHDMLAEEAKTRAGRDAIGIRVWKRGGVALSLACKWDSDVVRGLPEVVRKIRVGAYSRSLLYRLRELMPLVSSLETQKETAEPIGKAVLVAEYLKSRRRELPRAEAEAEVEPLVRLISRPQEVVHADGDAEAQSDPVMLAVFLEEEGYAWNGVSTH